MLQAQTVVASKAGCNVRESKRNRASKDKVSLMSAFEEGMYVYDTPMIVQRTDYIYDM